MFFLFFAAATLRPNHRLQSKYYLSVVIGCKVPFYGITLICLAFVHQTGFIIYAFTLFLYVSDRPAFIEVNFILISKSCLFSRLKFHISIFKRHWQFVCVTFWWRKLAAIVRIGRHIRCNTGKVWNPRDNKSHSTISEHRRSMHADTDCRSHGELQRRGLVSSVCAIR